MQKEDLKKLDLPDCPGVYLFTQGKGRGKKVLYVGKATSLRDRVRSYFDDDLIATRGPRLVDMVTQADSVDYETSPTVLEALVREAALIRHYDPPANAMGKDDKTFLYAVITDEEIPRVLAERGKDIDFERGYVTGLHAYPIKESHGPFTSGHQLREGLRLIRRIFPFYDTDKPLTLDAATGRVTRAGASAKLGASKHHSARLEFNRQIGQYPREFNRKAYQRTLRNVSMFLAGHTKALRQQLQKDMREAAEEERFEDAAEIRGQLFSLDHIQDVSLIKEDRTKDEASPRIEAYDTAHISGTNAIGVMVVVDEGVPAKKDYRTFRIRGHRMKPVPKASREARRMNDDIASLKELLSRRLPHTEWEYPKAIVVDGGKTHKKAAEEVLREAGVGIPVVAVVKDDKHRPREVLGSLRAGISDADAVLANSEAHRFSLARHRAARRRSMTGS
ncbi:MAG TPA: UvrB/UvrC motif-containing protein [Candidatus Paceibacterota bacterium]